ncbi:MAG: FapA family protein [bacterium]|nr:FapA family protein [bacterium]
MDRLKALLNTEEEQAEGLLPEEKQTDDSSNYIEIIAYSIEEGLETASRKLNSGIADLEYEILEKGSNGFLGIGKRPFRLLIKRTMPAIPEELQKLTRLSDRTERDEKKIENRDGYFKIRATRKGIMLIVYPPQGRGKKVPYQEVQNAVYQRQLMDVNAQTIQKVVERPDGRPLKLGEWQANPEFDGKFSIEMSDDEMKAYVTLIPPRRNGRITEYEDIFAELEKKNINFGIKEDVINDSIENDKYNQPLLIAEGNVPVDGQDAQIDYKFRVEKEIKLSEDERGKVNFKELDLIENVVVGQVLAKKMTAKKGQSGKTITGRELPAKDGRDVQIIAGKNTKLSDDKTELIAEINGQVVYTKGRVSVEPVYEVKGDVSVETGNIVFLGTVIIRGNVEDGFSVKASGNIEVKGSVGRAQLEAEGDIIIKQGLLGKDSAMIVSGNDVLAKFIEHAKSIEAARDVIVAEGILHSFVDAGKRVICNGKRAIIAGGRIRAGEEINAKTIGSPSFTETQVEVGFDPKTRQQLLDLNEELRTGKDRMRELAMNINTLDAQRRSGGGKLTLEKEELLIKMMDEREQISPKIKKVEEQIAEIKSYFASIEEKGRICAQKEVFPKVKLIIKDAFLEVKDSFKYVTFIQEAGNIKVLPYEEAKVEASKGEKLL